MSDLKSLPRNEPTAFERQLLDAVAKESPSAEQRLRVREALGLPIVATTPPPAVAGSGLVKAAAAGALVISAAAALWFLSSSEGPSKAKVAQDPPASVVTATAKATPEAEPAPSVPVAELPLEAPPAAAEPASPRSAPSSGPRSASGATSAAGPESGSDLGEQLRLIEAARAAVAARKPAVAATAIADYRSRFPRGAFGQEASVLNIQTLDLQGNHARAAELARSFLARYPKSPHVGVVQRIAER